VEPRYQPERQKARALTGSAFGIYSRLRSGMQTKKGLLTNLTFLMTQCSLQLYLFLFCNQTRHFIYRSG